MYIYKRCQTMHWRAPIDKGSGNYIYIDTFNVIITII